MVSHGKTGRKCKVAFLHVHVITFLSVGFLCLSLVVPLITCTVDSENNSNSNSNGGVPGRPNSSSSNNEEGLRKELIKVQILQRLGLNDKPQVDLAHKISKDLVLQALRRTENFQEEEEGTVTSTGAATSTTRTTAATGSVNDGEGRRNGKGRRGKSKSSADDSNNNSDAGNYAKTSEIIAFPDKGPELNGHNLLSFSYAGDQAYGLGGRVRKAHLWVKMDYRSSIGRHFGHLLNPRGVNLYVFQVLGNFSHDSANAPLKLHSDEVSLEMVISRSLSRDSLGWQKLDVTSVVQKWYGKQSRHRIRHATHHHHRLQYYNNGTLKSPHNSLKDKLILLVDCSGCGSSIHPIIFGRENSNNVMPSSSSPPSSQIPSHRSQSPSTTNAFSHHSSTINNQQNHNRKESHGNPEGDENSNNNWDENYLSTEESIEDNTSSSHHHHPKSTDLYSKNKNNNNSKLQNSQSREGVVEETPHIDNFTEIPFLVLETETGQNFKRSRRRAMECSPRVKHCCKQRFYVDFRELGWDDWIIAPRGYHANYCRGHCGGPHRTPDTFLNYHTHVIEEYRRTNSNLSGITPCCAPTKFSSMSLIYFGPDLNIIKRDLPKMIVEECGCP